MPRKTRKRQSRTKPPSSPATPFRFLDLLPKVRSMIYKELMAMTGFKVDVQVRPQQAAPKGISAMLYVNKACHKELKALWSKAFELATFAMDIKSFAWPLAENQTCAVYCRCSDEYVRTPVDGEPKKTGCQRLVPTPPEMAKRIEHLSRSVQNVEVTEPMRIPFDRIHKSFPGKTMQYFEQLRWAKLTLRIEDIASRVDGSIETYLPEKSTLGGHMAVKGSFAGPKEFAAYLQENWRTLRAFEDIKQRFKKVSVEPVRHRNIEQDFLDFNVVLEMYTKKEVSE